MREEKFKISAIDLVKLLILVAAFYIFLSFKLLLYNIQKKPKINGPTEAQ